MSTVSDNLLGLKLDEGAGYFIKESAASETGVASITNVLLETFKFIGSNARQEYLMPQMTQLNWAMRAFENRIPDCQLLFEEAMSSPEPQRAIAAFDELLKMAVGSASAPCMRVIPGTAILANAYKTAESLSDSLFGQYSYDGYVRQRTPAGAVPILPRQYGAAELAAFGNTIAQNWTAMLNPFQLEQISRLIRLYDTWVQSNLSQIGDNLDPNEAASILRRLSIYAAQPAWMNQAVTIDQGTGSLEFNGVVTQNLNVIRQAMPPAPIGNMPYHNGFRHIAAWAQDHNRQMADVLQYNDVLTIPNDQVPAVFVARMLNGATRQMTFQDAQNVPAQNNQPAIQRVVLRCEHGRDRRTRAPIVEYCVLERQNGVSVNTLRGYAYNMWRQFHEGQPNVNGEGVRRAQTILSYRQAFANQQALIPGLVDTLQQIQAQLPLVLNCQPLLQIANILATVGNVQTAQDMTDLMDQLRDPIDQLKPVLPTVKELGGSVPENALVQTGYTVIGSGRYAPDAHSCVALVPIRGRGVAPVRFTANQNVMQATNVYRVAVVLEEPPTTVYSPVRTMMATAFLQRLIGYLNGQNMPPGYNFTPYDPANPFGAGQPRPCPRSLLNRQLDRYEQSIVTAIENATVDGMPDILKQVQKIVDARYFLNYMDEILESIINREDWIYTLQSLIISLLIHDGAMITNTAGDPIESVDAGVVPRNAAEFIFGTVMRDIVPLNAFQNAIGQALNYGLRAAPNVMNQANLARIIRGEVLFSRAINGLDLLKSLVDGSNTLVQNIHVGAIQHLIDVDLTNELMSALQTVFNRDYLGLVNRLEYEAPWDCAEWLTQFAAFAFSVDSAPICYDAIDVAAEAALDSNMPSVSSALSRVGFRWTEIAPSDFRVRGADQNAAVLMGPMPMASNALGGFYNNAPVAHQMLKVTTVVPSYDIEAYNLLKAYLTMNTSRTYFVQPVGTDISDEYTIRLGNLIADPTLDAILGVNAQLWRQIFATNGVVIEKTPALSDIALIVPYVASYLQKPALTRDVPVPQVLEIDNDKSLAYTSGVVIVPDTYRDDLLTPSNGLAITITAKRSISTALPWVGS